MDDARFNQSAGNSAGDGAGYDYFGTATPSASGPGGSAGSPSSSPLSVQPFGAPGASPFGGPMAYAAPAPTAPSRGGSGGISGGKRVLLIVVGLLVVLGGVRAWSYYQLNRPINLPATFNGLSPSTDPARQLIVQQSVASLQAANPHVKIAGQLYGSGSDVVVLMAGRGRLDITGDMDDPSLASITQIGHTWCALANAGKVAVCERTGSSLGVVVLVVGGTEEVTATLTDSAYGQL